MLLNILKSRHTVLGIDASSAMRKLAADIGIDCIQGYFNEETSKNFYLNMD